MLESTVQPDPVKNIIITNVSSRTVSLNWTAPVKNKEIQYEVMLISLCRNMVCL